MKRLDGASWRVSRRAAWGVFWGEASLKKPHRVRYWLNNDRAREPEVFDAEVGAVCDCYAAAMRLHEEEGAHVVSTDEKKTGISRRWSVSKSRPSDASR